MTVLTLFMFREKGIIDTIRRNDYNEMSDLRLVNEITNSTKLASFHQNILIRLVHCPMITSLCSVCFANSFFFSKKLMLVSLLLMQS